MKDAMRQMPFRGHHGMPGFPPFGRGGRNDFHHPWQGDFSIMIPLIPQAKPKRF